MYQNLNKKTESDTNAKFEKLNRKFDYLCENLESIVNCTHKSDNTVLTNKDFNEYKQKLEFTLNQWKLKVESFMQVDSGLFPGFVVSEPTVANLDNSSKPSSKPSSRRMSASSYNKENQRPEVNSQINPKEAARRALLISLKPKITSQ